MPNAMPATKPELTLVSLRDIARVALAELYRAQSEGVRLDCESLSERLGIRRNDARTVLTNLHREGLYDVMRRSLTLAGFAHGLRFADLEPAPMRRPVARLTRFVPDPTPELVAQAAAEADFEPAPESRAA